MFEVLIVVVVLLVIVGAGKVRSAGSDLGAALKGFRRAVQAPSRADQAVPPAATGPAKAANPAAALPDAEFPEVLAARARGSRKPGA